MQAFTLLCDRYRQSVTAYVSWMLGVSDQVDSVVQGVFDTAFTFAGTYQHPEKFSTWLFTIAGTLTLKTFGRDR